MSMEFWKAAFDWAAVVLVGLSIIAGAGALITGKILTDRQASALEQFKVDLATANDRAAQADLKRLILQNRIADIFGPRRLTPEQSVQTVKGLVGLKGKKIDVYVFKLDNPYNRTEFSDDSNLGIAFVHTLRLAGLDAEGWLLESCQNSGASNLVVGIEGNDPEDKRIAERVVKSLPAEIGVWPVIEPNLFPVTCTKFSNLDPSMPNKRTHDAKISIVIGKKVTPLLTREMLEVPDEQSKLQSNSGQQKAN